MYVGSSYNDAHSGETLSSLSEKSDPYFTTELSGGRCGTRTASQHPLPAQAPGGLL
jgi:hypothetical protein